MATMGVLMKYLYENGENAKGLLTYLESMPINFFKIYTLKVFIETVEVVDVDIGYMRFRTMVYAFQDHVIPMIC